MVNLSSHAVPSKKPDAASLTGGLCGKTTAAERALNCAAAPFSSNSAHPHGAEAAPIASSTPQPRARHKFTDLPTLAELAERERWIRRFEWAEHIAAGIAIAAQLWRMM